MNKRFWFATVAVTAVVAFSLTVLPFTCSGKRGNPTQKTRTERKVPEIEKFPETAAAPVKKAAVRGSAAANWRGIEGKVVKVTDGDTITILTAEGKQERIRLTDIDAPEKGQNFSEKSRQHLAGLVAGKTVTARYQENRREDIYGRILGMVYVEGVNANEEMVAAGLAWVYRGSRNSKMRQLQDEARRKGLNIWSEKKPVDPYDYRRQRRGK